jgi:hypothetical protein
LITNAAKSGNSTTGIIQVPLEVFEEKENKKNMGKGFEKKGRGGVKERKRERGILGLYTI